MIFSELIPSLILAIVLMIGAAWDLRFHKIPNWLTFPAVALAITYHSSMNGFSGFLFSLEGIGVGIAILIPFYLLGGMGAGDVKLLGASRRAFGSQGCVSRLSFYGPGGRHLCAGSSDFSWIPEGNHPQVQNNFSDLYLNPKCHLHPSVRE